MLISFSINFKQFFFFVFHTFFTISHLFSHPFQLFFGHCTTPCLYQPIKKKVSPYLSRFSNFACYKFVTSYARTHAQTNFWITIPRVGLKALELKLYISFTYFLLVYVQNCLPYLRE